MSDSTRYTPGPWTVEPRKCGFGFWVVEQDKAICEIMHDEKAELLQALRMVMNVMPAEPPAAGRLIGAERRHYDAIMAAKAAIKKAEGRA